MKRILLNCVCFFILLGGISYAQEGAIEINGDAIEYSIDGKNISAVGNVVIIYKGVKLLADSVNYNRDTGIADAKGSVSIESNGGTVSGKDIIFDFGRMMGEFKTANVIAYPYYGYAEKVRYEEDGRFVLYNGYVTTSDYDNPEYRIASDKISIYPQKKLVAKNVVVKVGKQSIMYFPWWKHNLQRGDPRLSFVPGYDSDWGSFVLGTWNHPVNDNIGTAVHLDYRRELGIAGGGDIFYHSKKMGRGRLRTYYTDVGDRNVVIEQRDDRYKVDWFHQWRIGEQIDITWKYFKFSDNNFLKDYFEDRFDNNPNPKTFLTITQGFKKGVLSFQVDLRVNQFEDKLEKLPEIKYTSSYQDINGTNFYLKYQLSYSHLVKKRSNRGGNQYQTRRFDMDSEISYPKKVSFLSFKPFVGGRLQYYSQLATADTDNSIRKILRAGTTVSTRFYKVKDVHYNFFGRNLDKIRHIISPSINYVFQKSPTLENAKINQFDDVDDQTKEHNVFLSLENKIQIKYDNKVVDFMRMVVSAPFEFQYNNGSKGFSLIDFDIDITLTKKISVYIKTLYDTSNRDVDMASFEAYINGRKWNFGVAHRYHHKVNDQITLDFSYLVNPKWKIQIYERLDVQGGKIKEQNYLLTRDLHSWELDFNFRDKVSDGRQFLFVFRLKAFPDIGFDFGNTIGRHR